MNESDPSPPPTLRGTWRFLYILLGFVFVGLATAGVLLPILPTTPFLLLASYFFIRSSPRLNAWLLRSRIFGGFLRDWQQHRGVRLHVKVTAIAMLALAVGCSTLLANLSWPWLTVLIVLALVGLLVILRLRTIRGEMVPEQAET